MIPNFGDINKNGIRGIRVNMRFIVNVQPHIDNTRVLYLEKDPGNVIPVL